MGEIETMPVLSVSPDLISLGAGILSENGRGENIAPIVHSLCRADEHGFTPVFINNIPYGFFIKLSAGSILRGQTVCQFSRPAEHINIIAFQTPAGCSYRVLAGNYHCIRLYVVSMLFQ